ncbi:MAG: DUF2189 domain-containing protein [Gammaproteobacteria bacterium]|nr:DUF2189 domain-containing protein [Gammaproteobacteria bacterium]NNF48795.1 DUF2189 domain-containing protein [Woeseiaceae bacterium]MBT8094723.1 DUF2189 domain-containing protein [Gammaproteobacteria bacterium]MBT8104314.1 DUF2189 domain-containing protein [Gammaproteobacteria bacterium]NNK24330.1 DUF2189 domain-containing protein [Woeseiaceae bacterium]
MAEDQHATGQDDELPFVARCRKLSLFAPFRWLRLGFRDLVAAPRQSLAYGLAVALLIGGVSLLAWTQGSQWFMYAMVGGFVFLAPLTCIGLYAISAQLERGQEPQLMRSLRAAFKRHLGNEMVFALALLVVFLVWARAAVMVGVFFPTDSSPTVGDWVMFLGFGSMIGAVFAAFTFSVSAFSLPMIMHRNVDSITAIVTSINAVLRNKGAMVVWLTLIVTSLVVGVLTAFVGLIVIIPVIGYAAWHGYLETIIADDFPRHEIGITAMPREDDHDDTPDEASSSTE